MTRVKLTSIEYKDSGRPCYECYHSWGFVHHPRDITYYCKQKDVVHFHEPSYRYKRGISVPCSIERKEPRKQGFLARLFHLAPPPSTPCGPQGRLWDPMSVRERSQRNKWIDRKRKELKEGKREANAPQKAEEQAVVEKNKSSTVEANASASKTDGTTAFVAGAAVGALAAMAMSNTEEASNAAASTETIASFSPEEESVVSEVFREAKTLESLFDSIDWVEDNLGDYL